MLDSKSTTYLGISFNLLIFATYLGISFNFCISPCHIVFLFMQAPPVERYLRDLLQYALGVLHIVTLVPNSRKMIVNATLSNNRVGIAVILDAASVANNYVDPEVMIFYASVIANFRAW